MVAKHKLRDRSRGAKLGLAAGDALGTTLKFQPPKTTLIENRPTPIFCFESFP